MKKVGKACYLIKTYDGKSYVLKLNPPSLNTRSFISSLLLGGNILFKRELLINQSLNQQKFKYLKFPPVLKTNNKSYMIFEYIDGQNGFIKAIDPDFIVLLSLLEFNFLNVNFNSSTLEKFIMTYFSTIFTLLRDALGIIRIHLGSKYMIHTLLLILRCNVFGQKNKKQLLIHNDLHNNNIICNQDNIHYFIDFEDAIYEKKWLLIDIVCLVFDLNSLSLDKQLLQIYINELNIKGFSLNNKDLKIQLHIALLKRCTCTLKLASTSKKEKELSAYFIKNILLAKNRYQNWLNEQLS